MSYGFVVKSDRNKVLVHSEAENLFFVCKKVLNSAHRSGIPLDTTTLTQIGDTGARYRTITIPVKVPKSHPNHYSLVFFPFVDTSVFTFGTFALQSVNTDYRYYEDTHLIIRVVVTALTNTSFKPTIYLFANSPEVVEYHDTEEVNEYGVEVFKPSNTGTPYKVYDSSRTPLVITGTATVRPHSKVPIESGKDNLKVRTNTDIPVTSLNNKRTLMYCPMQADGGRYKSYDEDYKIKNCYRYVTALSGKFCKTDRYRYRVYGLYCYYKAVFKVKNGRLCLSYLPVTFKRTSVSDTYEVRREDADWAEALETVSSIVLLPFTVITKVLDLVTDIGNGDLTEWADWMFGSSRSISNAFLVDTLNKTRNSNHNYLVLFADKSLYD